MLLPDPELETFGRSNWHLATAPTTHRQPILVTPSDWFLNADYLSDLDEEYRKKNRQFRAFVRRTAMKPNHPLGFLTKFTDPKGRSLFDAGHVVPVKTLQQRGTTRERLVVEDRTLNRSKQAKKVGGIVNVDGVPVDCDTVNRWRTIAPRAYRARLDQFWKDCQAKRNKSNGWYSTDQRVHELEFVLGLPGEIWVRKVSEAWPIGP